MKDRLLWGLFFVIAACAVAALVGFFLRKGGLPKVPDFTLVDRSGKTVTRRDLLGEVWVADFVFLGCKGTCPRMVNAMTELEKRVPEARYVAFTVDPVNDTPEELRKYSQTNRVGANWLWMTTRGPKETMQELANRFLLPADNKDAIVHSDKFVLVDRYGRIRGQYAVLDLFEPVRNEAEMARLEADLRRLLAQRAIPVHRIPAINCGLNVSSAFFLVLGLLFIKAKKVPVHRACMLIALGCSALFLAGYLTAHYYLGSTSYRGSMRTVYFTILISHTILAAFIVPLVGVTLFRALGEQFDRHRRIARWTLPLWLYVSVTGVVIYFMLY